MCFSRRRIQIRRRRQITSSLRITIEVIERDTQIVEHLKRIWSQLVNSAEKTSGPFILLALSQYSCQREKRLGVGRRGSFDQISGRVRLADAIGPISHIKKGQRQLRIILIGFASPRKVIRGPGEISRIAIQSAEVVVSLYVRRVALQHLLEFRDGLGGLAMLR